MNYLIDTHTLLWYLSNSDQLPLKAKQVLDEKDNVIFISQASFLEMSIKMSLGKLKLPVSWSDLLYYCERGGIHILPIETSDSIMLNNLPFHHRDPFDRILICQALNRQYTILSKNGLFDTYGLVRVWD
jgi:PIN domain nuclease of toxin-antitoxin system